MAVLICIAFVAWYFNWRGALADDEIDRYMSQIEMRGQVTPEYAETIRKFLAEDDGKEFVMLNVIKLHDDKQPHPESGDLTEPWVLIREYQNQFMGRLISRAGHPLFLSMISGGYIDTFGISERPDYTLTSMVRYRSRRELAELFISPQVQGAHEFKTASIEHTFNFPTKMQKIAILGPGQFIPGIIILFAALAHIGVITFRS